MHWRTHLGKHVWRQVNGKDVLHAPLPEEGDQAARPRAHIQNPAAWPQIRDCFHNLGHPLQSKELQMALRLRSRHGPLASAAHTGNPAAQTRKVTACILSQFCRASISSHQCGHSACLSC